MTSMKNGPILLLLLYYNIFWRIRWAIAQDGGLLCPEGGPVLDSFGMPGRCDAVNPRCPAMSFCYANRLLMDGRRYYCCPVPKGPRVLIAPPGTIVQPASMDGVQNYLITIAVGPGGPFSHPPGPMGGPPPGPMIGSASSFSSMTTLYASPGDPCRNGAVCTGGSYCHQYVCTCPPSSVIESKICVPSNSILPRSAQLPITTIYANPGEPCGNGRAVCAGGSYCFQFLCICPPNNIVDMNQCIPNPTQTQITIYADPGQPCGNGGAVCSGGSYCLQYVCTCPPQHIIDSNVCIPLKTTFMNQPDNIAKIFIPPGAGPLDINVVANPGEPCVPTTVCQGGSYCLRGFCACPGNTMNQNNMCLPMPSTLSPSSGFPQPLPIPVMTLPPSSPGFVREARSNITANPGQSCANGEICIGFSLCNDEVCKCPVQCGNGPCIISNNQCVPMPTGGPNGGGHDGLTSAPSPPYDPMEPFSPGDGKTAGPFQSCSSGEICVGGSYCLSGVCTCPPGNYIQDGRCVTVINQNQSVGGFGSVPTSGHYIGATGLMPVPSAPGIVLNASGVAPSASAVVPRTVGGPPPPHHLDSEAQYQQYTDTTYTTSPTTETTTTSTTTITTTSPWYANLWRTEMPPIEDKTKPPGWNRLIREQIFGSIVNGPPSAENVEDSGGEAAFGVGPKGTPLGQRCVTTEQCAGSAFCVGGVCQCAAGDMQIGDFCVSTRQLTKMFSNESTRDSRSFWRTRRRRRRSSEQQ